MTPPLEEARRLATLAADESHDNGSIENATRSIAAALLAREKAGMETENQILRDGLDQIGRQIRGNDQHPVADTARFYQGYNGGLNTAQVIARVTLAKVDALKAKEITP